MSTYIKNCIQLVFLTTLLMPAVWAGEVNNANMTSFVSGTTAVAAEVNGNFDEQTKQINDNNDRIALLEQRITEMQAQLDKIQANSVLSLGDYLLYTVDANGYPTALFDSINVQIVNGANQTTVNGLGNLIVGYNNPRTIGGAICSDGGLNEANCVGGTLSFAVNHKSGSHNIIAGDKNSYSQTGGVVFGSQNAINRINAVVSGGSQNIASGTGSSVSGGESNTAAGRLSSVSGGIFRTAPSTNNWAGGSFSSTN